MKVTKWVDMGQDVEISIGADDIRIALAESFDIVTRDRLGEEGPTRFDITSALNSIGAFLNALTDEQISLLTDGQRNLVGSFLAKSSARFKTEVAA
jgi:hypothetical protein